MTSLFHLYRINDVGVFHWIASAGTPEQAITEAAREHVKDPRAEYRAINPSIGTIKIIPTVRP